MAGVKWSEGAAGIDCGRGTLRSTELTYEGEWKEGLRCGQGLQSWADGSSFDGAWDNDVPHGKGKMVYEDASTYSGDWVEGVRSGSGVQSVVTSQHTYTGNFEGGEYNGSGVCEWANGCCSLLPRLA